MVKPRAKPAIFLIVSFALQHQLGEAHTTTISGQTFNGASQSYCKGWLIAGCNNSKSGVLDEIHVQEVRKDSNQRQSHCVEANPCLTLVLPFIFALGEFARNSPYTAKWKHGRRDNCPNLKSSDSGGWNNVTVKYGAGTEAYQSLAHLFNDWYHGYTKHADYPWIMIRIEGT